MVEGANWELMAGGMLGGREGGPVCHLVRKISALGGSGQLLNLDSNNVGGVGVHAGVKKMPCMNGTRLRASLVKWTALDPGDR